MKLIQRKVASSGSRVWVARWTDPVTGQACQASLEKLGVATHEARREWAVRKSQALASHRHRASLGEAQRTETSIEQAVTDYFEAAATRLKEKTIRAYHEGIDPFAEWSRSRGVTLIEAITPGHLAAYREWLVARPGRRVRKGGARGERESTSQGREPRTVNKNLESIQALTNHWRRLGFAPLLNRDNISESFRRLKVPRPRPEFLSPTDVKLLLEAANRHDGDNYVLTRNEKSGQATPGTTSKYDPISAFVKFVLLSGCRLNEALNLRWACVDLDALDENGQKVGEIRLTPEDVKTAYARTIDLAVSPALRRLLMAMKAAAGGKKFVFGGDEPWPDSRVEAARKRLKREFGAPRFSWQMLRRTTGTFLTNAPGIFGAASVWRSARQLGHSPQVAERHYLGLVRGIPREARTLEDAMRVSQLFSAKTSRKRSFKSAP